MGVSVPWIRRCTLYAMYIVGVGYVYRRRWMTHKMFYGATMRLFENTDAILYLCCESCLSSYCVGLMIRNMCC